MSRAGGKGGYRPQIERLKRHEKRSHLLYYLPIHDSGNGERLGVLGDLSRDGLLLVGPRPYQPGQRLHLRIQGEPGSELAGDIALEVTGEVRWSAPDANPAYTATGIRLLESDAETRRQLEELLERLGLLGAEHDDTD